MKKILSIFMSAAFLLIFSTSTYATGQNTFSTERFQSLLNEHMKDEYFELLYKADKNGAERIIYDIIERERPNLLRSVYGSTAYKTVPVFKQETSIWCGFASVQMILDSFGVTKTQSEIKSMQDDLLSPSTSSVGVVWCMANPFNDSFSSRFYTWHEYKKSSNQGTNYQNFKDKLFSSLVNDRPAIIRADTKAINYYNGASYKHYIVIDYYDTVLDTVEFADCNYYDSYRGYFMAPTVQAFNAMNLHSPTLNYLISL